jgi:hypothetical protein
MLFVNPIAAAHWRLTAFPPPQGGRDLSLMQD